MHTVTRDSHGLPAASKARLWRGLWLALALGLLFLVGAAVQSVATLLSRMRSDVMKAATGGIWASQIGREVVYFLIAQLVLHLAFGLVVWGLAWATAVAWPRARERFGRMVVLWFCVLAAGAIAYNATWFPRTGLGVYYHDAATTPLGPLALGQAVYLGAVAAAIWTLVAATTATVKRVGFRRLRYPLAAGLAAVALVFVSAFALGHRAPAKATASHERPHIIMLGIDSLRLECLQRFGGTGLTKHLDRFLAEADIVRDTTTPAARTYPSWTAILTGRNPSVTGARFNLASREVTHISPTLGDVLRGQATAPSTLPTRFASPTSTRARIRPGRDPAHRRCGFRARQLQRIAARVGDC